MGVIEPSELLREYRDHHGLTDPSFASLALMDPLDAVQLFAGTHPIDEAIAETLERVFGRPKAFWLQLQHNFDLGAKPMFLPDWRSPPGETMRDLMDYRGLTDIMLGDALGFSGAQIEALLSGVSPITPPLAAILAVVLGATPEFWLKRDADYRR